MKQTARWEIDDRHYCVGFATDNDMNIQGFHSPNLLVIITEAHNVDQAHIDAVKRLNPSRMLLTGNAFASGGEFYDAFHSGTELYKTVEISAYDTPNVVLGEDVIPGMVGVQQIEERKKEWGEESALYQASVLGQFPDNLEDAIVPRVYLMEAIDRELVATGPALCQQVRHGGLVLGLAMVVGSLGVLVGKLQVLIELALHCVPAIVLSNPHSSVMV